MLVYVCSILGDNILIFQYIMCVVFERRHPYISKGCTKSDDIFIRIQMCVVLVFVKGQQGGSVPWPYIPSAIY